MKADCHIHMLFDGVNWKNAINSHREQPDRNLIYHRLQQYAESGFTYLRDGGDRWQVGKTAREMAQEFDITYRTPLARLCRAGHYGGFIGKKFENLKNYAELVKETRNQGGDFIKVMISGLMDFNHCGVLTEEGLPADEIKEMIHISHEEGMPIMAHANGARVVEAAATAGADSVEHGAYLDEDALNAMAESETVWCPTLATIGNLRGTGRYDEQQVRLILESEQQNLIKFADLGGLIAPGSDAGAWAVPHVQGGKDEYRLLKETLGKNTETILLRGVRTIMSRF